MTKIKYFIIGIFIIIIILSVVLSTIKKNSEETQNEDKQSHQNQTTESKEYIGNGPLEPTYELEEIQAITEYQIIENCINIFLTSIYEEDKILTNSILIDEYNSSNINDKLNIDYKNGYQIKKVYKYEAKLFVNTYFVYGNILNKESRETKQFNFVINVDTINETFELAPMKSVYSKYVTYDDEDKPQVNKNIKNVIKDIKSNDLNKVKIGIGPNSAEILSFYFQQYIVNMIYDTKSAYELLDNECKNEKFSKYEEFEEYVNDNIENIEQSYIEQYKINNHDEYREYICKDNNGNIYIFKETKPMDYIVSIYM